MLSNSDCHNKYNLLRKSTNKRHSNNTIYFLIFCLLSNLSWSQDCIKGNCTDGTGTLELEDGSQFISEFKNGIPLGKATILFANGDKITGTFEKKDFFSNGNKTYQDGKYVGDFKNNKRHGQGTYAWFNGGKYIGSWKDDKRHGLGICIGKNLIHSPCEWKDGIAQSPRKNFP